MATVPPERWTDAAGVGGSSIAFLAFHTAYHEDLAVNAVLRRSPTVLSEWRGALGLGDLDIAAGLAEAEPDELTAALDLEPLGAYLRTVHESTRRAPRHARHGHAGGDRRRRRRARRGRTSPRPPCPGCTGCGTHKPAAWFLQWEAIGHRVNHLGEMVSVRNRLGLSPF